MTRNGPLKTSPHLPQENTALIKEINELRREIRSPKQPVAAGGAAGTAPGPSLAGAAAGTAAAAASGRRPGSPGEALSEGLKRELEIQRDLISRLREDTAAKEARIKQLESLVAPRPASRERLPPMEGFPGSVPPQQSILAKGASGSFSAAEPAAAAAAEEQGGDDDAATQT